MAEVGSVCEPLTESPDFSSGVSTVEGDLYGESVPETPADPGPVSLPEPVNSASQESPFFSVPGVFKYDPTRLKVCADTSTPEGITLALEQTQSSDPDQLAVGLESLESTPSLDACFLPTEENKPYILAQTVSQDPLRNAVGWKTAHAAGIVEEAVKLVATIVENFLKMGPEGKAQAERFVAGIKDPQVREQARNVVVNHPPAEGKSAKQNVERTVPREAKGTREIVRGNEMTRDTAEHNFSGGGDPDFSRDSEREPLRQPSLREAAHPADDRLAIPVEGSGLHTATIAFQQLSFTPLQEIQESDGQEPKMVVLNTAQPIGSTVLEIPSLREGNGGVGQDVIPNVVAAVSEEDLPEKIVEKEGRSPGTFVIEVGDEEVGKDDDGARYPDDAGYPTYAPVPPQMFLVQNFKEVAAVSGTVVRDGRADPQKRATPVSDRSNTSDHRGEDGQFAPSGRGGRGGRGGKRDDERREQDQDPAEEEIA